MIGWWNNSHNKNILYVKYEDMISNLAHEMRRLMEFLSIKISAARFENILSSASFKSMQMNRVTNYEDLPDFQQDTAKFIRSGKIGQWKEYFTVAQNEWFDMMYKEKLNASGIDIQYE